MSLKINSYTSHPFHLLNDLQSPAELPSVVPFNADGAGLFFILILIGALRTSACYDNSTAEVAG